MKLDCLPLDSKANLKAGLEDVFFKNKIQRDLILFQRICINTKGHILHAWCLMTNHVRLIFSSKDSGMHFATLRDLKNEAS